MMIVTFDNAERKKLHLMAIRVIKRSIAATRMILAM